MTSQRLTATSSTPTRQRLGTLGILLVLALTVAGDAAGQMEAATNERRLRALFSNMPASETLQLITPELLLENTEFVSLEPSTVELRQVGTGVPISVDLSAIRGVAVQKRHWLQGTLWGLGGGVLAGSVFGLMIGSFNCETINGCGVDESQGARLWGTALGIVGGGIGFTLGRRDVYWQPIFP